MAGNVIDDHQLGSIEYAVEHLGTNLVVMMVSGLTISGTVMVGQYVGAKKQKDASETVGTMFTLMALVGLVLGIAVFHFDPLATILAAFFPSIVIRVMQFAEAKKAPASEGSEKL